MPRGGAGRAVMDLLWILVLAQTGVMLYAVTVICRRAKWDRRCPSHDRVMAVRGAMIFALAVLAFALVLYLGSEGKRYTVVRDAWHLGLLAAALTTGIAIRVLAGDGRRG